MLHHKSRQVHRPMKSPSQRNDLCYRQPSRTSGADPAFFLETPSEYLARCLVHILWLKAKGCSFAAFISRTRADEPVGPVLTDSVRTITMYLVHTWLGVAPGAQRYGSLISRDMLHHVLGFVPKIVGSIFKLLLQQVYMAFGWFESPWFGPVMMASQSSGYSSKRC